MIFRIGGNLLLALTYFYLGKLGLQLAFINASASTVWPPTGVALAALLLWGPKLAPGIFLGALAVNFGVNGSWLISAGIATGNSLEVLVGAALVTRFAKGRHAFESARGVVRFIALAGITSTTLSATIGVTSLLLGGLATLANARDIWLTWWVGDMVSAVVLTPFMVVWVSAPRPRLDRLQALEAVGVGISALGVALLVFGGWSTAAERGYPLEYLTLLPLGWAAFRFAQFGATTVALLLAATALLGTLRDYGPFAVQPQNESLILLQLFIGVISLAALVLAAVTAERNRTVQRLQVQDAISRFLAESPHLPDASARILQTLAEATEWDTASFWQNDGASGSLGCIAFWQRPGLDLRKFAELTNTLRFEPGVGLPGRVWARGEPAWIGTLGRDSNFPRAAAAIEGGLQSGFSFPITIGPETVGVIECFSRQKRDCDEDFLQMMTVIGRQLGQFIERKRAESALRESEELYRTVAQAAADAIVTIDEDSTIITANRATSEIFGYAPTDLIGQPLTVLMPPHVREPHRAGLRRFLQTKERRIPWNGVALPGLHRSGREIPVEVSFGVSVRDGHHLFTGIIRDISERKRSEDAVRLLSEAGVLLASSLAGQVAFQQLAELVAKFVADSCTIDLINADRILLRVAAASRIALDCCQLPLPDLQQKNHPIARAISTGTSELMSVVTDDWLQEMTRGSGPSPTPKWQVASCLSVPIRSRQQVVGAFTLCLATDSARHFGERDKVIAEELSRRIAAALDNIALYRDATQARDALKLQASALEEMVSERTAKLQETVGELEAFSYSVSHDLRAPLRAMQSYAKILTTDEADSLSPNAKGYLERIRMGANRLDKLIQDILTYSRVARAAMPLENVDLEHLLREIIDEYPHLQPPRAEISVTKPLAKVHGHEAALMQCLSNLLTNAAKFVGRGVLPRIQVWTEQIGSVVRVFVRDNGIGIEDQHQQKIFRIFERVHGDKQYEGTGIGLAIAKKAVERMGGEIGLESAPGAGSTFWLQLKGSL
jgi:PAS domain S-box-containing protein